MSQVEGQEYTYRGDFPQSSLMPLHHAHGSPGMSNSFGHTEYSRMEESLRVEDCAAYRLVQPLTCDQLPPGAQLNSATYPEYLLAQTSHYPHLMGQSYGSITSPWPAQEAYHYGMPSGEICHAVPNMSSEGAESYSLEAYSTHQAFRHQNILCDVNRGGQVMMLSPGQMNHTVMANHSAHPPVQSHSSDHCSSQDKGWRVSPGPPQTHLPPAGVTFNLIPGPYASQLHQTLCPTYTETVGQNQMDQTKGHNRENLEKLKRPCNCTKSQCLKLYCECFANGEVCKNCKCINCFNNTEHEAERCQAIKVCLDRNPGAFQPKIGSRKQGNVKGHHTKGCNCRRSGCLKNYCECYEANIMCTSTCKCVGCRNYEESPKKKSSAQGVPVSVVYYPTRSPLAGITPDVVGATCGCLLAKAEDAEKEGYILPHAEKMILEEFGQCMTQIVQSIFKSTNVQLNCQA
ncbi:spexin prohormone 2 [Triplophysa dalaica]|uniref:spexin prohormone 2 n=1 Tax=Triplophysa dalaica TaxID=1582913 RepID=UPI0024DFAFFC|nr:spexin prohormone 2 [Triplophysa dalaica]XP_056595730.1 spexin prohormone 2 [Triplophysa dalaica]XP_056595731.1 spexin prohormone 2 [Triplophysa dalaica]